MTDRVGVVNRSAEHRYIDAYDADSYYLSDHVKERPRRRRPSYRDEMNGPSCSACYRPVARVGYCRGCVESGAADQHRRRAL